ncbi:energy transducer TonB [Hymenobacter psoromatis]|uniref:energy transducer TonB n=1 Tax=Hymenobacter psoromatis TaxID=1484116 RepID=UPI001CBC2FEC|nr:energy transducer TonB [Hymenobacter psoromatis]
MSLLSAFLTDNLDEIVFEGRNQAYGAYRLRQDYQHNLASAGGITMGCCLLLLLSWAAWRHLAPAVVPMVATTRTIDPFLVEVKPVVIEKPKLAITAPPAARRTATHPAPVMPTEVAKDDTPQPRPTPPTSTQVVDGPVGPATLGPATPTDLGELTNTPGGAAGGTGTPAATNEPFIVVEKMPEFAGGQAALLRYLRDHLRYPGAALAAGVGGRVFMSFVVGSDGKISEVTILKGLGYGLDEEALRVVRQMPAWTPGYQSQHPVAVRFTLPITFQYQ